MSATGFFRTEDGLTLHYRDYDRGSGGASAAPAAGLPVVCLPGLTRNARDFEPLASHLASRYRVICLDFRGRGRSQYAPDPMTYVPRTYVRDLSALLEHLRCGPAVLIGTSLGGLVGTLFCAVWPKKVLGLILNDVGPEIDPVGLARIASYVGKAQAVVTWDDASLAVERLDRCVYPDYGAADWMRTARRRYVEDQSGHVRLDYDLSIAKAFATPASTPRQWPFVRRLRQCPVLLVRGELSDILSRDTMHRMQQVIPGLQIVEIPNRGHTPTLEEPIAQVAIDNFLRDLPPKRITRTRT